MDFFSFLLAKNLINDSYSNIINSTLNSFRGTAISGTDLVISSINGSDGDFYINTDSFNVYYHNGSSWVFKGNIFDSIDYDSVVGDFSKHSFVSESNTINFNCFSDNLCVDSIIVKANRASISDGSILNVADTIFDSPSSLSINGSSFALPDFKLVNTSINDVDFIDYYDSKSGFLYSNFLYLDFNDVSKLGSVPVSSQSNSSLFSVKLYISKISGELTNFYSNIAHAYPSRNLSADGFWINTSSGQNFAWFTFKVADIIDILSDTEFDGIFTANNLPYLKNNTENASASASSSYISGAFFNDDGVSSISKAVYFNAIKYIFEYTNAFMLLKYNSTVVSYVGQIDFSNSLLLAGDNAIYIDDGSMVLTTANSDFLALKDSSIRLSDFLIPNDSSKSYFNSIYFKFLMEKEMEVIVDGVFYIDLDVNYSISVSSINLRGVDGAKIILKTSSSRRDLVQILDGSSGFICIDNISFDVIQYASNKFNMPCLVSHANNTDTFNLKYIKCTNLIFDKPCILVSFKSVFDGEVGQFNTSFINSIFINNCVWNQGHFPRFDVDEYISGSQNNIPFLVSLYGQGYESCVISCNSIHNGFTFCNDSQNHVADVHKNYLIFDNNILYNDVGFHCRDHWNIMYATLIISNADFVNFTNNTLKGLAFSQNNMNRNLISSSNYITDVLLGYFGCKHLFMDSNSYINNCNFSANSNYAENGNTLIKCKGLKGNQFEGSQVITNNKFLVESWWIDKTLDLNCKKGEFNSIISDNDIIWNFKMYPVVFGNTTLYTYNDLNVGDSNISSNSMVFYLSNDGSNSIYTGSTLTNGVVGDLVDVPTHWCWNLAETAFTEQAKLCEISNNVFYIDGVLSTSINATAREFIFKNNIINADCIYGNLVRPRKCFDSEAWSLIYYGLVDSNDNKFYSTSFGEIDSNPSSDAKIFANWNYDGIESDVDKSSLFYDGTRYNARHMFIDSINISNNSIREKSSDSFFSPDKFVHFSDSSIFAVCAAELFVPDFQCDNVIIDNNFFDCSRLEFLFAIRWALNFNVNSDGFTESLGKFDNVFCNNNFIRRVGNNLVDWSAPSSFLSNFSTGIGNYLSYYFYNSEGHYRDCKFSINNNNIIDNSGSNFNKLLKFPNIYSSDFYNSHLPRDSFNNVVNGVSNDSDLFY